MLGYVPFVACACPGCAAPSTRITAKTSELVAWNCLRCISSSFFVNIINCSRVGKQDSSATLKKGSRAPGSQEFAHLIDLEGELHPQTNRTGDLKEKRLAVPAVDGQRAVTIWKVLSWAAADRCVA